MAINVLGVIATAVNSGGLANKQQNGYIDARSKSNFDTYTTLGTEVTGSTIKMCGLIPVGALIRNVTLVTTAITGGASIAVGDSTTSNRYIPATVTSSAAKTSCIATAGIGYEIGTNAGDNQILLTVSGGTLAVSGTIEVIVDYAFD